jgi:DNA-binding transcriptional MerR regulator
MIMQKKFPGTQVPVTDVPLLQGIFSVTSGITLSQVCEITGLEAGAVHNWIKRGYVNPPIGRKYSKSQVARIILINMLRDTLALEKIAKILSHANGDLLDRADDIMDDSDIYSCLCDILIPAEKNEVIDIKELFKRTEEYLIDFEEPFPGAKERLELVLKIIICAWESAYFKKYADHLTEKIQT